MQLSMKDHIHKLDVFIFKFNSPKLYFPLDNNERIMDRNKRKS